MRILRTCLKRNLRAFSIVEVQMSAGVLIMVVGAACAAHFFGLRLFYQSRQVIGASQEARVVLGKMREEIRGCTTVIVGTGNWKTFAEIPDDKAQAGSAVQIFPTTNTTRYTLYYHDADNTMKKWDTDKRSETTLANNITNQFVFKATDYNGNVLTNNENNRVIEISLQFHQEKGDTTTKHGGLQDYYQVQTKATRRKVL